MSKSQQKLLELEKAACTDEQQNKTWNHRKLAERNTRQVYCKPADSDPQTQHCTLKNLKKKA